MKYTEEEKKAVENIKEILSFNLRNQFLDDEADNIEILLNLLEKQQKEIERLSFDNKILGCQLDSNEKNIDMLKNEILNNMISKEIIKKEIEKLEKLIKDIANNNEYSHEIPLYKHDKQLLKELLKEDK